MSKKILISAFSSLTTDQRIEKVCRTLHENGYEVHLIGNDWGGNEVLDRPYSYSRIKIRSKSLKTAYFEFNAKLYTWLKNNADQNTILWANDLDALYPSYRISKKLGIPLVYDSHEIFTELPSVEGRFTQKIWRFLEKKLMPSIQLMMTESQSYADWFQEKYGVEAVVVGNLPRRIFEIPSFPSNTPKKIIYQGAINQSRGLKQTILAMKLIENAEFQIAGAGPLKKELEDFVKAENVEDKVKFIGKLMPEKLREFTKTADVGISLEENNGVSYLYSLPNKVGDYIQSRVPLVMINFPEMMRIKKKFNVGEVVENHEPKLIADALKLVLEKGRASYESELSKAAEVYCWESEEKKILGLVDRAVSISASN